MKYKVLFYQCAVIHDPAYHKTKRAALLDASDFLAGFRGMSGHTRRGSIYIDGYAAYVDGMGATECSALVIPHG